MGQTLEKRRRSIVSLSVKHGSPLLGWSDRGDIPKTGTQVSTQNGGSGVPYEYLCLSPKFAC